jgi:polysaccharide biosynthesis protein PslG
MRVMPLPGARGLTAAVALLVASLAIGAGAAQAKGPVFGVVPQDGALPSAGDLGLMRSGGASSIRLLLDWATIEGTQGSYNWGATDVVVRRATKHDVEPLFFLYGTPDWAAHQDGRSCAGDCSIYAPSSAATRDAFARFAGAAVERYGPNGDFWRAPAPTASPRPPNERPCRCSVAHPIRAWQIWTEQNSPKYFAPEVDVAGYAQMLIGASAQIKAVDPGADVVLGGMWGPPSASNAVTPVSRYLRRLYEVPGIESSFDSIALHPYAPDFARAMKAVKTARKTVARAGDPKAGTWITEIGWAAGGPRANAYVKGRQGQARLLSRTLSELRRKRHAFRLRGVFWYTWRDKGGGAAICEWCGHSGLRTKRGSAKPAWRAFTQVAKR